MGVAKDVAGEALNGRDVVAVAGPVAPGTAGDAAGLVVSAKTFRFEEGDVGEAESG